MKFHVIFHKAAVNAHSPIQVVEQTTGLGVGWVNRYLDREYVRRLANTSLRIYAYNLLHFVRWWESAHHTGDIVEADLTESTLLDYLRFQSSLQPRPCASTINARVADADRDSRNLQAPFPCEGGLAPRESWGSGLFGARTAKDARRASNRTSRSWYPTCPVTRLIGT